MLTINPHSAKSSEQKTKKSQKSGDFRGKRQEMKESLSLQEGNGDQKIKVLQSSTLKT